MRVDLKTRGDVPDAHAEAIEGALRRRRHAAATGSPLDPPLCDDRGRCDRAPEHPGDHLACSWTSRDDRLDRPWVRALS